MRFVRRVQCTIRISSLIAGVVAASLPITQPNLEAQQNGNLAVSSTQAVRAWRSGDGLASGGQRGRVEQTDEPPAPGKWGDQGAGTYINPVMPGDVSDLDAIRVGGDYYAISSTMQYSPGVVILHSKDLVNWTILGHVVQDLTVLDPELD